MYVVGGWRGLVEVSLPAPRSRRRREPHNVVPTLGAGAIGVPSSPDTNLGTTVRCIVVATFGL